MSVFAGPTTPTTGLLVHYDFANTKSYVSGNSTVNNLVTSSYVGEFLGTKTYNSGGLLFDGATSRIYFSASANSIRTYDSTTIFTVSLPVVAGGQRCIMSYRGSGAGSLYIGKSGGLIFSYYNFLSNPVYLMGTISANVPFVCAVVCDATSGLIKHYINGVVAGSASRTGWQTTYATGLVYLGYDAGGTNEFMGGTFYNFQHYNRVLSDDEILQNFYALRGRFAL